MKGIPMKTWEVRAILDNRKTVTRRVVKLKYSNAHLEMRTDKYGTRLIELQNKEIGVTVVKNLDGTTTHKLLAAIEKTPPYSQGDILYVKETFFKYAGEYVYRASAAQPELWNGMWRPSIHMPREAARIFLRVTGVKVERLQEITEAQAMAEGVIDPKNRPYIQYEKVGQLDWHAKHKAFPQIWDGTIKPSDLAFYGWDANPWVWVIEFENISREEVMKHG